MPEEKRTGPIVIAGLLIGLGAGALIDGGLFRMAFNTHPLIAGAANAETSKSADMFILGGAALLALLGWALLAKAKKDDPKSWSGQVGFGAVLLGVGVYALVEGILMHHVLRTHRFFQYSQPATQDTADIAYLIVAVLVGVVGLWAVNSAKNELEMRDVRAKQEVDRAKSQKGDRTVYLD